MLVKYSCIVTASNFVNLCYGKEGKCFEPGGIIIVFYFHVAGVLSIQFMIKS